MEQSQENMMSENRGSQPFGPCDPSNKKLSKKAMKFP